MTPRMKLFSNRMDRTENNKENSTEIQIKCFANQKKNKKKIKIYLFRLANFPINHQRA